MLSVNTRPRGWVSLALLSVAWACSSSEGGQSPGAAGASDAGSGASEASGGDQGTPAQGGAMSTSMSGAPGSAGVPGEGGAGGEGPQLECVEPSDCELPATNPEGCAEAECVESKCVISARDADNDGFLAKRCQSLDPEVDIPTGDDCNDGDETINPDGWDGPAVGGHDDGCNDQIDQDCSGIVDDGTLDGATCTCTPNEAEPCATTAAGNPIDYPVLDQDGKPVGECAFGSRLCLPNGTWAECTNAKAPTPETCDELDNDCDSLLDEDPADPKKFYCDGDNDQVLAPDAVPQIACAHTGPCSGNWLTNPAPSVFVDCDDHDGQNEPGNSETCGDGKDNNCDDVVDGVDADDDLKDYWYQDVDGDGWGNDASEQFVCNKPGTSWVVKGGDCADVTVADKAIHPGAAEICNNKDDDCDDGVDNGMASTSCEVTGNVATMKCANPPGAPNLNECVVNTCSGSYLDCDGGADCEVNGANDDDYCGNCQTSCYLNCQTGGCDELVSVHGGVQFSCGRKASGRMVCWGDNTSGQLGDGTVSPHSSPGAVSVLATATASDVGDAHGCAVQGGSVYCWGSNASKQAGLGTAGDRLDPGLVSGLSGATGVAAGANHSCAVHGGAVSCWGANDYGQLGSGITDNVATQSPQATLVTGGTALSKALAVSAGTYHSCAVVGAAAQSTQGSVMCWGSNFYGQLGDNVADHGVKTDCAGGNDCSPFAVSVSGITDAVAVTSGFDFSCALKATGSVVCWGRNLRGQLGNNATVNSSVPVAVSGLAGVSAVSANGAFACAVASGTVYCWGANNGGQLGDNATHGLCGSIDCSKVPVSTGLSGVKAVGAGETHACAVLTNGRGYCWGEGDNGRLGTGNATDKPAPAPIARQP